MLHDLAGLLGDAQQVRRISTPIWRCRSTTRYSSGVKRGGLEQDRVGDADLADVVQQAQRLPARRAPASVRPSIAPQAEQLKATRRLWCAVGACLARSAANRLLAIPSRTCTSSFSRASSAVSSTIGEGGGGGGASSVLSRVETTPSCESVVRAGSGAANRRAAAHPWGSRRSECQRACLSPVGAPAGRRPVAGERSDWQPGIGCVLRKARSLGEQGQTFRGRPPKLGTRAVADMAFVAAVQARTAATAGSRSGSLSPNGHPRAGIWTHITKTPFAPELFRGSRVDSQP